MAAGRSRHGSKWHKHNTVTNIQPRLPCKVDEKDDHRRNNLCLELINRMWKSQFLHIPPADMSRLAGYRLLSLCCFNLSLSLPSVVGYTLRELSKVNAFSQCITRNEGLITDHYDHSDSTNFLLHLADQVATRSASAA